MIEFIWNIIAWLFVSPMWMLGVFAVMCVLGWLMEEADKK